MQFKELIFDYIYGSCFSTSIFINISYLICSLIIYITMFYKKIISLSFSLIFIFISPCVIYFKLFYISFENPGVSSKNLITLKIKCLEAKLEEIWNLCHLYAVGVLQHKTEMQKTNRDLIQMEMVVIFTLVLYFLSLEVDGGVSPPKKRRHRDRSRSLKKEKRRSRSPDKKRHKKRSRSREGKSKRRRSRSRDNAKDRSR